MSFWHFYQLTILVKFSILIYVITHHPFTWTNAKMGYYIHDCSDMSAGFGSIMQQIWVYILKTTEHFHSAWNFSPIHLTSMLLECHLPDLCLNTVTKISFLSMVLNIWHAQDTYSCSTTWSLPFHRLLVFCGHLF